MSTRAVGNSGEAMAVNFLETLGWSILGRNLHYRFGEIDILADAGDFVVIVEVKAKKSAHNGLAIEMITPTKQRVLQKLAKWVTLAYNKPVRVDVIAIDNFGSPDAKLAHYPFAIEER
jgi:putative endonuclease